MSNRNLVLFTWQFLKFRQFLSQFWAIVTKSIHTFKEGRRKERTLQWIETFAQKFRGARKWFLQKLVVLFCLFYFFFSTKVNFFSHQVHSPQYCRQSPQRGDFLASPLLDIPMWVAPEWCMCSPTLFVISVGNLALWYKTLFSSMSIIWNLLMGGLQDVGFELCFAAVSSGFYSKLTKTAYRNWSKGYSCITNSASHAVSTDFGT